MLLLLQLFNYIWFIGSGNPFYFIYSIYSFFKVDKFTKFTCTIIFQKIAEAKFCHANLPKLPI